jgi:hypothetical protein
MTSTSTATNGAAPKLAPNHAKLIADSAISPEVADARGYFTARIRASSSSVTPFR